MSTKLVKPPPEFGPYPISVSGRGLVRALLQTALDKAPVLGVLTRYAENQESERNAERLVAWADYVRGEQDPDAFADNLERALGGPEAEFVRAVVIDTVRGAIEAVDPAVVPRIGRLANLYFTTKTPNLRLVRQLVAMFTSATGEVLDSMRLAVAKLVACGQQPPIDTMFLWDPGPEYECWNWYTVINPDGLGNRSLLLLSGDIAHRVVTTLVAETHGPFSYAKTPPAPTFSAELLRVLNAVL